LRILALFAVWNKLPSENLPSRKATRGKFPSVSRGKNDVHKAYLTDTEMEELAGNENADDENESDDEGATVSKDNESGDWGAAPAANNESDDGEAAATVDNGSGSWEAHAASGNAKDPW